MYFHLDFVHFQFFYGRQEGHQADGFAFVQFHIPQCILQDAYKHGFFAGFWSVYQFASGICGISIGMVFGDPIAKLRCRYHSRHHDADSRDGDRLYDACTQFVASGRDIYLQCGHDGVEGEQHMVFLRFHRFLGHHVGVQHVRLGLIFAVVHADHGIHLVGDILHGERAVRRYALIAQGRVGAVESVFMCEAIRTITFSPFQTDTIVFCGIIVCRTCHRHEVAMELMDGVVFGIDIADHVEGFVFGAVGCSGLG